jgi:D-alanine-D-alanine ligase
MSESRKQLKITVMRGGPSAEREVSLRSGTEVARALRSLGHEVQEVDPQTADWKLPAGTELVFLALHGTYGEDGTVQEQLEKAGALYTGCGPEASRVGFDKVLAKERFVAAGVPTARSALIESAEASWPMGWNPPVVLKPARQGSSVGLQFVERVADWGQKLEEAMRHDSRVLMEERVMGTECTVGILGEQPLPILEVQVKAGVYDYQTKYTPGTTNYFCPARLDEETTKRVQGAALAAFRAIGGRDYSRVDVIVKEGGEPMVLEVNTLPGMTKTSSFPKVAAAAGIGYAELCQRMVELAIRRGESRKQK